MRRRADGAIPDPMKAWAPLVLAGALAALTAACGATTRHKVLTFLFDGVPPLAPEAGAAPEGVPGQAAAGRPVSQREHGPFAARQCGACHEAAATNALVAPKEELCFRCHDLDLRRRYVHGPIASGGCLVCHDPHSSMYRFLLVSESDQFCFHCHEREAVAAIEGHGTLENGCTECHDAHASDNEHLLK
jgi:predicted CXXCH cytochrome family protein